MGIKSPLVVNDGQIQQLQAGDGIESFAELLLPKITTPSNPSVGKLKLYAKADGKFYYLDENGVEIAIGSGGEGFDHFVEYNALATEGQTQIVLADIPASKDSIFLALSSAIQGKDTFTLTGNTITVDAMPALTKIYVKYALLGTSGVPSEYNGTATAGQTIIALPTSPAGKDEIILALDSAIQGKDKYALIGNQIIVDAMPVGMTIYVKWGLVFDIGVPSNASVSEEKLATDVLAKFKVVEVQDSVNASAEKVVDSIDLTLFKAFKWFVYVAGATKRMALEIIAVEKGSDIDFAIIGIVGDSIDIEFDVSIDTGAAILTATNNEAEELDIKFLRMKM